MRTRYALISKEQAEAAEIDPTLYRNVGGKVVLPEAKAAGIGDVTLYTQKEITELINKEENGTDYSIRTGAH